MTFHKLRDIVKNLDEIKFKKGQGIFFVLLDDYKSVVSFGGNLTKPEITVMVYEIEMMRQKICNDLDKKRKKSKGVIKDG